MQSLRDAGIVLIVILLLVSVRVSPLEDAEAPPETASWTPQAEAAAPVASVPVKARSGSQQDPAVRGLSSPAAGPAATAGVDPIQHCAEIELDLQTAAETIQIARVVRCSA
jgi:hypothetical protein